MSDTTGDDDTAFTGYTDPLSRIAVPTLPLEMTAPLSATHNLDVMTGAVCR